MSAFKTPEEERQFREMLTRWKCANLRIEQCTAEMKSLREEIERYENQWGPLDPRSGDGLEQ